MCFQTFIERCAVYWSYWRYT